MGLSFLQQLLTVACLAFASGLLLGIAVLRGEVGGLRSGGQVSTPSPRPGAARRKRPRRTWSETTKAFAGGLGDLDPALRWVLVSLALMITASAIITRLLE